MIFLSNNQGTITAVDPSPLYQGASEANEIILIAPFPVTSSVSLSIKLPNGVLLEPLLAEGYHMQLIEGFTDKFYDANGYRYNAWRMTVDYNITGISGDLTIQFLICKGINNNGKPIVQPTNSVTVNIGDGVAYLPPSYSESDWDAFMGALSAVNTEVEKLKNMSALAQWDYAITNIERFTTETFEEFAEESQGKKFTVIVKGCKTEDLQVPQVGIFEVDIEIPENCVEILFIDCQIYGSIWGHSNLTIDGFVGKAITDNIKNISDIRFAKLLKNCKEVIAFNCISAQNCELCSFISTEGAQAEYIDNVTFRTYSLNFIYLPTFEVKFYAINLESGSPARVSNVKIVAEENDKDGYYTIKGAQGLTNVFCDDHAITYEGCTFASPFTCQNAVNDVLKGKVPVFNTTGQIEGLDVYGREDADEHFATKEDLTTVYKYKGTVDIYANLPNANWSPPPKIGDVYNVENETILDGKYYPPSTNFAWDGEKWDPIGGQHDLIWDHVIVTSSELKSNILSTISGNVLVKGLGTRDNPIYLNKSAPVSSNIKLLKFLDCYINQYTLEVGGVLRLTGLRGDDISIECTQTYAKGEAWDCQGDIDIKNFANVHDCEASTIENCLQINNVKGRYGGITITNCKSINNIYSSGSVTINSSDNISNIYSSEDGISITDGKNISNIWAEGHNVRLINCDVINNVSGYLYLNNCHNVNILTSRPQNPNNLAYENKAQVWTSDGSTKMGYTDTHVDYVITDANDFKQETINGLSGIVVIENIDLPADERGTEGASAEFKVVLNIPEAITELRFINCKIYGKFTAAQNATTKISGLAGDEYDNGYNLTEIRNFIEVKNCGPYIKLVDCKNVFDCHISIAEDCENLNGIYLEHYHSYPVVSHMLRCSDIKNVRRGGSPNSITANNDIDFDSCSHISNVVNLVPTVPIRYENCTHVDGFTCDDYFTAEDDGKVQVITADGTKRTADIGLSESVLTTLEQLHAGGTI